MFVWPFEVFNEFSEKNSNFNFGIYRFSFSIESVVRLSEYFVWVNKFILTCARHDTMDSCVILQIFGTIESTWSIIREYN